ncbi:amidase family protein [Falsiruegeria mediterranea]
MTDLTHLGVCDLTARIRAGQVKPSEVMSAHLTRAAQLGAQDEVFQFIDPSLAMAQAQLADVMPATGPLHGVPFAIMDTIDTRSMPTSWGAQLYRNRVPERNASCVDALLSAGAIPIGKTTTPAFAIGEIPNGAATAVAQRMAAFALCSGPPLSTNAISFKPTRGNCDLRGIIRLSDSLDALSFLARHLHDFQALMPLLNDDEGQNSDLDEPRIGFLSGSLPHGMSDMLATAECVPQEIANSPQLNSLPQAHDTILAFEVARSRAAEAALGPACVGQPLCDLVATGTGIGDVMYVQAVEKWIKAHDHIDDMLREADILLAPFQQSHWTSMNNPCVTLPGGLQIIGRQRQDARLLNIACRFFERTQAST